MQPIAKVVKIHYSQNSADIVFLDNNHAESGVPILSMNGAFQSGINDLPVIGDQKEDWSVEPTENDTFAFCGFILNKPVILGFLLPEVCEILFDRIGFKVDRHNSDVYSTIDKDGNFEFSHPSGTFLRIAESTGHEDLTGLDYDNKWNIDNNTDKQVSVHLEVKNGGNNKATIDIDPSGNITITNEGNIDITTQGNVAITNQGATDINTVGNTTITSPLVTVVGNLTVTGNTSLAAVVTSNGKDISDTHAHSDVTSGPSNTGAPV